MYVKTLGIVVAAAVAVAVSPWLGQPMEPASSEFVFWQLRVPRVVLGIWVGATLGLVGASFQAVLENPLATPSTVGTTAGASLGALAVLVLAPEGLRGASMVSLGAFLGALTVSMLVAVLAAQRRLRIEDLLLAGIAISLGAGAATTGLQLQADAARTLAAVRWALGSLSVVGHDKTWQIWPWVVGGFLGSLTQLRALQAMTAGQDRALSQGVDVVRVRMVVLGAGSLAVGACVAACGPISFVGLVVPHLVRLFVGGGPRVIVPLSAVAGAGFLPFADGLARVALPGTELPVGVITAMLGAPTLMALLWQRDV
jgi:iron complex transport system permease protein